MAFTSAPWSQRWKYDVILSFRGETRYCFTDHLFTKLKGAGIKVFRDQEIQIGANILLELLTAIGSSRFAIVVISPDFASSTWCLVELSKMFDCMEGRNAILPIFYDVDPSDVRYLTGTFREAFIKHEKTQDKATLHRWRTALTKVAGLSGWTWTKNGSETLFIEQIVQSVRDKIGRPQTTSQEAAVNNHPRRTPSTSPPSSTIQLSPTSHHFGSAAKPDQPREPLKHPSSSTPSRTISPTSDHQNHPELDEKKSRHRIQTRSCGFGEDHPPDWFTSKLLGRIESPRVIRAPSEASSRTSLASLRPQNRTPADRFGEDHPQDGSTSKLLGRQSISAASEASSSTALAYFRSQNRTPNHDCRRTRCQDSSSSEAQELSSFIHSVRLLQRC